MDNFTLNYKTNLTNILRNLEDKKIKLLSDLIKNTSKVKKTIYICGNGGSAGNANHIANDLSIAAVKNSKRGLKVESLASNSAIITCLANDYGYDKIFSKQLKNKGSKDDLLLVLSGSGNSKNILNAIKQAKKLKMNTFAILGFDGGKCKKITDLPVHVEINDMQISEDIQLVIGHMIMKWLKKELV